MSVAPAVRVTSTPRMTTYMSVDMFATHARRGVDINQLVPNGKTADQRGALAEYIDEASNWMDHICQQTLAATVDVVETQVNVNRDGYVTIHPRFRPVIALLSFAIGATPSSLAPLASLAGVGFNLDQSFTVPAWSGALPVNTSQGPIQLGQDWGWLGDQAWVLYTYLNGFPITSLAAPITAGDTTISVPDTTGIVAGQTTLTTFTDPGHRFTWIATSVSTGPGGTGPGTVGCPAQPWDVSNVGPYPVMVSGADKSVISACAIATRALIKENAPQAVSAAQQGISADEDYALAASLLRDFVAPVA